MEHDSANLPTAIGGYAEAIATDAPADSRAHRNAERMLQASERAASLTRQLLAHSRQQVLAAQSLDLATVVDELGVLLRRLIGKDLRLSIEHADGDLFVHVDRRQIEQVLLNLALTARDALAAEPANGELLVVEDEPMVREIVTATLRRAGCVVEAENGAAALELARRQLSKIALVVTDLVTPRMGGQALATALRQERGERAIHRRAEAEERAVSCDSRKGLPAGAAAVGDSCVEGNAERTTALGFRGRTLLGTAGVRPSPRPGAQVHPRPRVRRRSSRFEIRRMK